MYCVFLVIIERSGKMVKSDIKNKIEKNDNTNANDSLIIKNDRIFLETPIIDKNDDNFGAITYSEQLYYAIKKVLNL